MNFLFILGSLALSLLGLGLFIWRDAVAAYDNDPTTPTLSEKLKKWANEANWKKLLMAVSIFWVFGTPALYLLLHLVAQEV